jgi:predicted SpoU family rRNA methylase
VLLVHLTVYNAQVMDVHNVLQDIMSMIQKDVNHVVLVDAQNVPTIPVLNV